MAAAERPVVLFSRWENGALYVIKGFLFRAEERRLYPYTLSVALPVETNGEGLPSSGGVKRSLKGQDSVVAQFAHFGAVHMGTRTANDTMVVAMACAAPGPPTIEVKTGLFKKQTLDVETRHDPSWQWYQAQIEPTPLEREEYLNRDQLQQRRAHGDDLSKERSVDFRLTLPPNADVARVRAQAEADGFSFVAAETGPDAVACDLARTVCLEPERIYAVCARLRAIAEAAGGELDGWGSYLVR